MSPAGSNPAPSAQARRVEGVARVHLPCGAMRRHEVRGRRTKMCTALFVGVLMFAAACTPPRVPGGGTHALHFRATGYFRTAYAAHRWWFVTPDGRPFYS